jgi:crossover junction endodeoxyribonuclease RuvC
VSIEATLAGIMAAVCDLDIRAVCLEGYARNAKMGREEAGELGAITKLQLLQQLHKIPCLVAPLQLKKFVTGKTTAKKDDMKLHVYKRWGFETSDDNVADAYGLARLAQALCEGGDGHTGAQREVLSALGNDQSWRLSKTELHARFR